MKKFYLVSKTTVFLFGNFGFLKKTVGSEDFSSLKMKLKHQKKKKSRVLSIICINVKLGD